MVSLPPFEQVVADHGPAVLRVCRALVGPHDAEDAWSDTFLAALVAYPRLRPESNIRGWLVTIAHHKAVDRLRANRRGPIALEHLPEEHTSNGQPRDLDLWRDVAALPAKQQAAVTYHYLGDLPYAQVAELLNSTETAVRRAAADGIAKLRLTIGREDRS